MTAAGPAPDRYAVLGHPVGHSRSPLIHAEFAHATGERIEYGLIDVPPAEFAAAVAGFFQGGGRGLNVTVPHKEAAARLVDTLTPRAREAGAVNTMFLDAAGRLVGDNTDGAGLIRDLTRNLALPLAGRRILLLGAGGAARGVLGPLLGCRPARLVLANRSAGRALELAAAFGHPPELVACASAAIERHAFDLIINATAASLAGEVPDVPPEVVGPETVCYDMAYGRGPTPFTRWALDHGARAAHQGFGMLVEQAAEAFLVWRGKRPATGPVLASLVAAAG